MPKKREKKADRKLSATSADSKDSKDEKVSLKSETTKAETQSKVSDVKLKKSEQRA